MNASFVPRYADDLNAGSMPQYLPNEEKLSDDEFLVRAKLIRDALKHR